MTDGGNRTTAIPMVLGAIASVQLGAAIATELFDELGPVGTVFLRLAFAAAVLALLWRPALSGLRGVGARDVWMFGFIFAAMNTSFYLALDRIPLGIAVTLEFVGPLGVALAASRQRSDVLWALLAAAGILLLSPGLGDGLDLVGVVLALVAGACWGAYILLAERVGRSHPGGSGLALAMIIGAGLMVVPGVIGGGSELLEPALLAAGFGIAVLSSAIPYSLELEALRRLPAGVFGVMMSLEPAVAATVGFFVLGQELASAEIVAIVLVVIASAGALRSAPPPAES